MDVRQALQRVAGDALHVGDRDALVLQRAVGVRDEGEEVAAEHLERRETEKTGVPPYIPSAGALEDPILRGVGRKWQG